VNERIAAPEWLVEPATRRLIAALAAAGIVARFVGGAVRDALLQRQPDGDIDLATPAPPRRSNGPASRSCRPG
jgi:poly(A) polymerase